MTRIVKITIAGLKADVETLTRKEIAKKYNISEAKVRETLGKIGLEKSRARQVVIDLVDEPIGEVLNAPVMELNETTN